MKMKMIMTMLMILSSIVIEVIRTVSIFFFYKRYFKCKKHKQKHISNIQPDISKQKNPPKKQKHLSNIQPYIFKQKKKRSKTI